jgi:NAD(P)-dependent dehydrogenase (short-subunit alcohol dehydrogenase family)
MSRFSGKAVVVTGGGHGIGRASALRFASEGARVAVVDTSGPEKILEDSGSAEDLVAYGTPKFP